MVRSNSPIESKNRNILPFGCIIAIILALMLALSLLSACSQAKEDGKDDMNTASVDSAVVPDSTETPEASEEALQETANEGSPASQDEAGMTDPEEISIASLKGPTSIGLLKLISQKPDFENGAAGFEIVANPEIMVSRILSGEVDIATLPTNVAVTLYNKGQNIKLGTVVGYGSLYLLSLNESIDSWDDLKDKEIFVPSQGSTPDVILRYLLKNNGLYAGKDVAISYTSESVELAQLIISGRAEFAVLPEPFVTMAINKNKDIKIGFEFEKEWQEITGIPLPMSSVVISSKLAEGNPAFVDEFLEKYEESINWVNDNPEEASLLTEKIDIGMDAATVKSALPRTNIMFTEPEQAREYLKKYIEILMGFSPDDIGGKIPDENFYY